MALVGLVGGAALGAATEQLRKEIVRVKDNTKKFKPQLEHLDATLETLRPVMADIEELNKRLKGVDYSETRELMRLMEDGKNLVSKCSSIGWLNFFKKSSYQTKLMDLDNKILKFHSVQLQANMARDVKTLLCKEDRKHDLTMYGTAFRTSGHDEITIKSLILKVEYNTQGYTTEIGRRTRGVPMEKVGAGEESLGEVFAEVVKAVDGMKNKASVLRTEMKQLGNTLQLLAPLLMEIDLYKNEHLTRDTQIEIERLIKAMKKGIKVISKCGKDGGLKYLKKAKYQRVLMELDNELLRFFNIHMQVQMTMDVKQVTAVVNGTISSTLFLPHNLGEPIGLTMGASASLIGPHDKIKVNSVFLKVEFKSYAYKTEIRSIEGVVAVTCIEKDRQQESVTRVSVHPTWITKLFEKTERYADGIHGLLKDKDNVKNGEDCILRFNALKNFLWEISSIAFRLPNPRDGVRTSIYVEVFRVRSDTNGFNSSPSVESGNSIAQQYQSTEPSDLSRLPLPPPSPPRETSTPPPSPAREKPSGAEHSNTNNNSGLNKKEAEKSPLHVLEAGNAAQLNHLILAIVLLGCFNLVAIFLILIYK